MPAEARWFVKTGLCDLALTYVPGSVLLALEALRYAVPYIFDIEHAHLGMVGWLVPVPQRSVGNRNTVIGIALWMLTLNRARFPDTHGRYPPVMVAACFWLLNGGLALRLVAEPWYQLGAKPTLAAALLLVAALAQPLAIAIFVFIAWQCGRGPANPAPATR
ncbi:MAG: hypothetical protein GIX03_07365 [Candidatus Eremiobacteraeota bacterium]|nr:hypothetical protein [Candidatus Eremiobacteraeota bacterium]MBC5802809.1 hypothetical protein [Candidatus Eremiobacteraeota bacterium]MBC5820750.1 hypothetical protein [Candidatus Eremiobacteraeota bacterium]